MSVPRGTASAPGIVSAGNVAAPKEPPPGPPPEFVDWWSKTREPIRIGAGLYTAFRVLAGIVAGFCLLLFLTESVNSVPTSVTGTLRIGFVGIMALLIAGRR